MSARNVVLHATYESFPPPATNNMYSSELELYGSRPVLSKTEKKRKTCHTEEHATQANSKMTGGHGWLARKPQQWQSKSREVDHRALYVVREGSITDSQYYAHNVRRRQAEMVESLFLCVVVVFFGDQKG